jgi:hypothetical protein
MNRFGIGKNLKRRSAPVVHMGSDFRPEEIVKILENFLARPRNGYPVSSQECKRKAEFRGNELQSAQLPYVLNPGRYPQIPARKKAFFFHVNADYKFQEAPSSD